ncbi:MAG TPA: GFA family protein [Solirubrobacteraceae bacterium]|nr:GFA family protein [Solirubrobacteraceae bacterium]
MNEVQRTATCSCGAVRAVATGEPVRVGVCHCLACQRRSGSAFAYQARFPRAAVTTSGEPREYVRLSDEGERRVFSFCPQCGVTVWYVNQSEPDLVAIPVGTFADPEFAAPNGSSWEERKHEWVTIPGDDVRHIY